MTSLGRHRPRLSTTTLVAAALTLLVAGCSGTDGEAADDASPSATGAASEGAPSAGASPSATETGGREVDVEEPLQRLEEVYDATLGVYAIDTATGAIAAYHPDTRFGFASTIKALAAGAVLETTTDEEWEAPDVPVRADDLVTYSPVMETRVGESVSLREAADAAVRFSDNTAGNILIDHLGGPEGLRERLRAAGDETTLPVRRETDLNDVRPGDDRDTSTPRALAESLRAYALGDVLDPAEQAVLIDLLERNTTGDALVRAGVPDGWTVGDKTGSAAYGTRNDIALAWPPAGADGDEPAPVVIAALSQRDEPDAETDDALIAEATAVVFAALGAEG